MKPGLRVPLVVWLSLLIFFVSTDCQLSICSAEVKSDSDVLPGNVVLEVLSICLGWCGAANTSTIRVYDDKRAELRECMSAVPNCDEKDHVLSDRSVQLTDQEFDELNTLGRLRDFQFAKPMYYCRSGIDAVHLKAVTYNGARKKTVIVWNYVSRPGECKEAPPAALDRMLEEISDLMFSRDKAPR